MSTIDLSSVRMKSLDVCKQLGYATNEALPVLDSVRVVRSLDETTDRLLAMHCVAAAAYGFDRESAISWLSDNCQGESVTPEERKFLETGHGPKQEFKFQIEGVWALYWSAGLASDCSFTSQCPQDFVKRLPDLKVGESAQQLRSGAALRPDEEIVALADLAYCIHWAINDSAIRGSKPPANLPRYVVGERRRALDWLLVDEPWDEISLDT